MDRDRLHRTQQVLREQDLDALLVGPSADLRYLVGYHALPLERLTLLIVPADGEARLVVPELEAPRAEASGASALAELVTWGEQEDPFARVSELIGGDRFAVQDRLWSSFLLRLQERLGGDWVAGTEVMRELRLTKSADEVDALRAAGRAIDAVHAQVPGLLRTGRSEHEIGRDIAELILQDHDEVNFVIVASGPNGASPHHETGGRILQPGDAVVVDIGGTRAGYCSDSTRNYVVAPVPDGYADAHEHLRVAQAAGVQAVRPGVAAEDVDAACRSRLAEAELARYFVHRTGHGIGVEEHEEPWIVGGNREPLRAGMAFSVEPGVYVPQRWGMRIEDIVVTTDDGVERLNTRSRNLVVVDGDGGIVETIGADDEAAA